MVSGFGLADAVGLSFTGVTLTVIVFGDASVSTPPFAVPPLSRTWKVNVAYGEPFLSATGWNTSWPAATSAAVISSPLETGAPSSVSEPWVGVSAMITAANALADVSLGSVNPKSAVLMV